MSQAALNDILAMTNTELIKEDIPNALAAANPLLNNLKDREPYVFNGGNSNFQFAINMLDNTSQGWIGGNTDVLNINPSQNFVYGTLQYKQFYTTVSLTLNEVNYTQWNPDAISKLTKSKAASALSTFINTISAAVWQTGSGSDSLRFNGIYDMLMAGDGVAYAGLNNTDYPNWYPVVNSTDTVVSYNIINAAIATLLERSNMTPTQPGLKSNYKPNLMLSRAAIQSRFKSQLQTQQRFSNEKMVKAGFENLDVDGIPWVVDAWAPDNTLVILSMESIHFGRLCGFWGGRSSSFDNTQVLPGQPIQAGTTYHSGNLFMDSRRNNAVFTNLTN